MKSTAFVIIWLLAISVATAQLPNLTDRLPLATDVSIGKLANGLTYYIRKDNRLPGYADLRLVVKVGSLHERDAQQGLAHFTVHMAFAGTNHYKREVLQSLLKEVGEEGIKFGADLSARSSFDETVYRLPIMSKSSGDLERGLLLLKDWAGGISFDPPEFDKEKLVVLEELRAGRNASDRIDKAVLPKLYENSRYASRLPAGNDPVLSALLVEEIKRFYRDWYRPSAMAVVVTGNVEPAEAERLIKLHFSALENPEAENERKVSIIPKRTTSEAIVVSDKDNQVSVLSIYYPLSKSPSLVTVGDVRHSVTRKLLQTMLSTQTTELLKKTYAPFFFSTTKTTEVAPGYEALVTQIYIKESIGPAIAAVASLNEEVRKSGFTAAELEDARASLLQFNESDFLHENRLEKLGDGLVRNFLNHELVTDTRKKSDYQKLLLQEITLEEVNQLAAKTLPTTESKLVVLTTPEKTDFPLPTAEQLLAMVEDPSKIDLTPPTVSLVTTPPGPGKVISTRDVKEGDYTELKFENGITVLLKPTDFKKDAVIFYGFRAGGQSLYTGDDRFLAGSVAEAIPQMGVGNLTLEELRKILTKKQTMVFPRIDATTEGLAGFSATADIETVLQLTYLFCTQPRRDDKMLQLYFSAQQERIKKNVSDRESAFQDSVAQIIYNYPPSVPRKATPATYSPSKMDRLWTLYKERFSNLSGYTFILVGSFDKATVLPLVATYLGSLPAGGKALVVKDDGMRPAKGGIRKDIKIGTEGPAMISLQFNGVTPYSEIEKLRLAALLEIVNGSLRVQFPEEFSAFSGNLVKVPYEHYSLETTVPCTPENVERVSKGILDKLEALKANGPAAAELANTKTELQTRHEHSFRDNEHWVRELQTSTETKSGLDVWLNYNKYVDSLTPADLKAAAIKYLDKKNLVQVVLFPADK